MMMRKLKIRVILFSVLAVILFAGGYFYQVIFMSNVSSKTEYFYFYVHTDDTFKDVWSKLQKAEYIRDKKALKFVLEKKNYPNHIHPGRYKIEKGMSSNNIADMLRSGEQEPVMVQINKIQDVYGLAGVFGEHLEPDSTEFVQYLTAPHIAEKHGFTRYNFISMFLPDSYELYWSTSVEGCLERFKREFDGYWNRSRTRKAEKAGLSPAEVVTLASIVYKEALYADEYSRIAGVYVNRLKKNIKLQADPTLIFAHKGQKITRVLNIHKKVNSPYNTYKHKGLPPGPIAMPPLKCIDAVLDYEDHDYLFFCAKPDFSGYHSFAKTYAGHQLNARKYRSALNKRKIYS